MSQMFLLRRLRMHGRLPATSWSGSFGVSAASLSSLVDGLVRAGYVRRERGSGDRRVVQVSLSPSGARLMRELETRDRLLWAELSEGVSASELRGASELLRKIHARALELDPPRGGSEDKVQKESTGWARRRKA